MKKYSKNIMYKRILALLADTLILSVILFVIYRVITATACDMWVFYVATAALLLAYPNAFQFSTLAATPGMLLMGLYVTFDSRHVHISHFKRMFWCIISCLPIGFGFWYGLIHPGGRTAFDMLSSSDVVIRVGRGKKAVPRIRIRINGQKDMVSYLSSSRMVIGRDSDICNFLVSANEKDISRVHCTVGYNEQTGVFLVEDVGSTFGTFLSDGTRLDNGKVYILNPGEKFYLTSKKNEVILEVSRYRK